MDDKLLGYFNRIEKHHWWWEGVEHANEQNPIFANNSYGIAKAYAHMMVDCYRKSYGMFVCAGILFNHKSPRRSLHFVTRKISMGVACIKLGIKNPPVNEIGEPLIDSEGKLHLGDLNAVRDWGYAKEYVEATWLMLQQPTPKDYVIGTDTSYSIKDACKAAFDHVGLNGEEHVISKKRDLPKFLSNHPLHNLYGGENAYLLNEYTEAIKNTNINLTHILNPIESDINLFPRKNKFIPKCIAK